jgi:cell division protease FtsH
MNAQFFKNMVLWAVILLMVLLLVTMLRANQAASETSYSEFISHLDAGEVEAVTIEGNYIVGRMKKSGEFATYAPAITDGLLAQLKEKKVQVMARLPRESPVWQTMLIYWFPFLLFIGLWIFSMQQIRKPK